MWLTSSRKDGQAMIRADTESRRLLYRQYARRSSSSLEEQRTDQLHGRRGSRGLLHRRCARRSSTLSEEWRRDLLHPQIPGGRIYCYFELSSLQSRVAPVWGWLSLGVFKYRKFSPGGLQVRLGGRRRRRFGRSTAENPEEDLHRRSHSRINSLTEEDRERIFIYRGSAAGSTTSTEEDRGRIFVCRGSAAGSTTLMEKDQGVDLHWQWIQESFYIYRRRREDHSPRHQDLQNLKYHQIQVVYFLPFHRR